jgi:hypothetical protein
MIAEHLAEPLNPIGLRGRERRTAPSVERNDARAAPKAAGIVRKCDEVLVIVVDTAQHSEFRSTMLPVAST